MKFWFILIIEYWGDKICFYFSGFKLEINNNLIEEIIRIKIKNNNIILIKS